MDRAELERAAGQPLPSRGPRVATFARGAALTLATRFAMALNSFFAGVIVARHLGPVGFGIYGVLNAINNNAAQFGVAGPAAATTYYVARDRRWLAPAFANAILYSFSVGSLLAAGIVFWSLAAPRFFGAISPALLVLATIAIPFQIFTLLALNLFLALGRVERYSLLDLLGQSALLLNALLALVLFKAGLTVLVLLNTLAVVGACLLVAALLWRQLDRRERARLKPDLALFRRMAGYGAKYHVLMIASTLVLRADLFIVNWLRGAAEAGIYAVASQMALLLLMLPNVIGSLLFPRIAAAQDASGNTAARTSRHVAFVMFIVCLACVPGSLLLPLAYGAEFRASVAQFWLLLPGAYLLGLQMVLVQHFVGLGLPRAVPLFWLATLGVNFALNLLLVPRWGASGAAISSTLSYALIFFFVALYFHRRTGLPFGAFLWPRREELARLISGARQRLFSLTKT